MSFENHPAPARPGKSSNLGMALGILVGIVGVAVAIVAYLYPRSPAPPGPPKERPQYIAQVDALCKVAIGQFAQYGPQPSGNNRQLIKWTGNTNGVYDSLYAKWKAVQYPKADEAKIQVIFNEYSAMLASLHTSANSLDAAADAFDKGDADTYRDLLRNMSDEWETGRQHAVSMDSAIDAYGFRDCSVLMNFNK